MVALLNSCEGGSDELTLTVANSGGGSGEPFTNINVGTGASIVYDTAQASHGNLSHRLNPASGVACRPEKSFTANGTALAVVQFRTAAAFNAGTRFISLQSASGEACGVTITGSMTIQVVNAVGATLQTLTGSLANNTWYRIELRCIKGTGTGDGTIQAAYYLGDSTSAVDSFSSSTVNAGTADLTNVRIGKASASTTLTVPWWQDSYQILTGSDAAALGNPWPGVGSPITVGLAQAETLLVAHPFEITVDQPTGSPVNISLQPATATFTAVPLTVQVDSPPAPTPANDPRLFPVLVELNIDGQWVDVSDRLRKGHPVQITRGSEDEAAQIQPSTTTLVFDNTDGFLSSTNAMSPWWPHIKRGTPVRVSVGAPENGEIVNHIRFYGNVDAWDYTWPLPRQRNSGLPEVVHATATASSPLRRMQQGSKSLRSALYRHITSNSWVSLVDAYWPMEDGSESAVLSSPLDRVRPLRTTGAIDLANNDSLVASAALPTIRGGETGGWFGRVPVHSNGGNWRVDVFVNIPAGEATQRKLIEVFTNSAKTSRWQISFSDTDARLQVWDTDGVQKVDSTFGVTGSEIYGENVWVLWSLHATQDGNTVDWDLNLVPLQIGVPGGVSGTVTSAQLGRVTGVRDVILGAAPPDGISHGHVIVSHGLGLGWLAGADTAWIGESAAHRFYRLCNEETIPVAIFGDTTVGSSFRGDLAFSEAMGPQRQLTLLELLQQCADVDGGVFRERRDAFELQYRTRKTLENQSAAVTFDMAARGLDAPFNPTVDDQQYRNDVTVTADDGASAHMTTDPPPEPGDLYEDEITSAFVGGLDVQDNILGAEDGLLVAVRHQLEQQASWRLHLGVWPDLRYRGLGSQMRAAGPSVIADWVAADLGDKLAMTNLMAQHPETIELLLSGYTETLDVWNWRIDFNGRPAAAWTVGVLDASAATPDTDLPALDSEVTTLNSTITSTATALDILVNGVADLTHWTQDNDQFPLLLEVGGEVIRANGWTQFGPVYIFSPCDRSVNGVVKGHAAGTPMHVAEPIRLSL